MASKKQDLKRRADLVRKILKAKDLLARSIMNLDQCFTDLEKFLASDISEDPKDYDEVFGKLDN